MHVVAADVEAGASAVSYTPTVASVSTRVAPATSTRSRRRGTQSTRWYGLLGCLKTCSSSSYRLDCVPRDAHVTGGVGLGLGAGQPDVAGGEGVGRRLAGPVDQQHLFAVDLATAVHPPHAAGERLDVDEALGDGEAGSPRGGG